MSEEKIWAKNEAGIKIVSLAEERLQEALQVMRESFYTDEPVAKGMKMSENAQAVDDLEQLTINTYKDGTSLVAIKDNMVVGAAFNKVQNKASTGEVFFEEFGNHNCKASLSKEYINIMIWMDEKKDVFEHYGVNQSMEVMFIATAPAGRRQGVGVLLVQGAMEVARSRGIPLCSAIFSSAGSQRIGTIVKWDQLYVGYVSDFEFKEQEYTKFPAQDQKLILMAYRL